MTEGVRGSDENRFKLVSVPRKGFAEPSFFPLGDLGRLDGRGDRDSASEDGRPLDESEDARVLSEGNGWRLTQLSNRSISDPSRLPKTASAPRGSSTADGGDSTISGVLLTRRRESVADCTTPNKDVVDDFGEGFGDACNDGGPGCRTNREGAKAPSRTWLDDRLNTSSTTPLALNTRGVVK